jgi:dienelactone hydrolase
VTAYLVLPPGEGPFPAVVFMHGSDGYRVSFLGEALGLAKDGIASLLPDAPYARPPHPPIAAFTPADGEQFAQTVVELRRGVDMLLERDDIDPERLGYVGFSWGGDLGFVLAAVERRVHSFVLMSGVPDVGAHLATLPEAQALDPTALAAYLKTWEPLAGVRYVPHAAPAALYFQGGLLDDAPTPAESRRLFAAESEPKKLVLYDADHEPDEQARSDRAAWLAARFGLS